MAAYEYDAVVTGDGRITSVVLYLEKIPNPPTYDPTITPIMLKAKTSSEKEYERKKIKLHVTGDLDYMIIVNAISGTSWTFTLTEKGSKKKVIELEDQETGDGDYANKSIVTASVKPN